MRFLARLIGWALFGLGIAELLWAGISLIIVAWDTWSGLLGVPGKVLTIVLLPLVGLLTPFFLGFYSGLWGPFFRLLIFAPAAGWLLIAAGGYLTQVGRPAMISDGDKIRTPEEIEALAKSIREGLDSQE